MKKILVVDNDQFFLEFIRDLLEKEGHEVQIAEDGLSALDVLDGFTPDFIFSDVIMPNIDGKRLCRILRRMDHLRNTKIIMISSIVNESFDELKTCGADRFISKGPFEQMAHDILGLLGQTDPSSSFLMPEKPRNTGRLKPRTVTRELLSQSRHLELLLDRLSEAIFEVMSGGRIVYANSAATRLTGTSEEQLLGCPFQNIFSKKDQPRIETLFEPLGENYRRFSEDPLPKVNDHEVLLEVVPISKGNGKWLMILENVSEQKAAARALEKSEERYRILFENANDAIFVVQDDIVKFPNRRTLEGLGCTEEELSRKPFTDFIHPDDRAFVLERHLNRLLGSPVPSSYSFRLIDKSGEVKWFESDAVVIDWEDKFATLNFLRNITARKTAEKEREQLRDQLTQAQKMEAIGTLAAGVAHNFNNILAIILGNTELTMADIPGSNLAWQRLEEIRKACLMAKDVIREILSFSRKSKTEQKALHIATVVTESLKFLRASIPTSVDIRQNIPNDTFHIVGDPTQIHQVMINLCINAAHAMEDKEGILEVAVGNTEIDKDTASKDPALHPGFYVQLSVSDTGNGISPEIIDRVFDPFFTTKDEGEGTGLGLSVVHGIVKGHHGRISVKSKPGKGTIFKILFPAIKEKTEGEQKESQKLPTGKESILFVDDEESIVKVNQQLLEGLGYRVTGRTDPFEALEFFRANSQQIDLIITDMTMPKMTGDKLARAILEIRSDMPIILCTGYNEKLAEDNAQELGIRKYVEKPIEKEILARSVREVLDGQ